ncbi:MAG: FkbM family methyltransferase [Chitinophagaceae bacterium]
MISNIKQWVKSTAWYKKRQIQKAERYKQEKAIFEAKLLPAKEKMYKKFVQPGQLVFDVGANEGNRVQPLLNIGATVIAVEPQPNCVQLLQEKFGNTITIEQVGLGSSFGTLEMFVASESTISTFNKDFIEKTGSTRFKHCRWENTIQVPIVTLDSLIEKYGVPSFCKIDVEGFEQEVLKGLTQPIPCISIEYCVPEMTKEMEACMALLHSLAPNGVFNYSVGETMDLQLNQWLNYSDMLKHTTTAEFLKYDFGDIYFKSNP